MFPLIYKWMQKNSKKGRKNSYFDEKNRKKGEKNPFFETIRILTKL